MENFIEDTLNQLIEEAELVKINAFNDFEKGKLFGYYFAITKILSQSESFDIINKLSKKLQEFNPESLLTRIN